MDRTHKELLRSVQYATSAGLEARIRLHQMFTPPGHDIWDFVWAHYDFSSVRSLLEVGCGSAGFWTHSAAKIPANCRIVLGDISPGMLAAAQAALPGRNFEFILLDADKLDYAASSFAVILAHFMLYHVDSPEAALLELKRVVTDNGWIGIVLNRADHLTSIFKRLQELVPGTALLANDTDSLSAEMAEPLLQRLFPQVRRYDYEFAMKVNDSQVVSDYARSCLNAADTPNTPEFWSEYRQSIAGDIQKQGFFPVTKRSTLFICAKLTNEG